MRSLTRSLVLLLLPILFFGCSEDTPTALDISASVSPSMVAGSGFPLYGLGRLVSATPGTVCEDGPHDDFDFWIGEWDVFNPEGDQIGTNSVERVLDGCVVTESWVSGAGFPGRSINAFDSETGQWHQTWVSANFAGHLRMSGELNDQGQMVLKGQREAVDPGFTIFDEYIWTPLPPDEVKQVGIVKVPAVGLEGRFVGIYKRRDAITPAPETPTTGCRAGGPAEEARQLDFWIGEWTVTNGTGKVLGTSRVSTDLSGCLLEERFRTDKGYRAVSFAAFDFWEQRWFRTYIDNRGERVEMVGTLESGALVFESHEGGPGSSGTLLQRVSVEPTGSGVRQFIEVSHDGGMTWNAGTELVYLPTGGA